MKYVQWMITGRCNLNCRHCYLTGCPDSGVEPDMDALLRTMDLLAGEGVRDVVLTGGEPLCRGDFAQIVRQLTARGINISRVITNGCLLTDELLTLLESLGQAPVFNISYDGDGGAHDALRRKAGSADAALAAFGLCWRRGFKTVSDVTVHRGNRDGLADTIRTLDSLGCTMVKAVPLFPLGNGSRGTDALLLDGEAFLDLACETIPRYYEMDIGCELYLSSYFYARGANGGWTMPALVLEQSEDPSGVALCRRDSDVAFLSASGKLMPCPGMVALAGRAGEFADVLDSGLSLALGFGAFDRMMNHTVGDQMRHNATCRTCEWALACGGGCRVAAMTFEGSFYGRDPFTCAFFRGDGPRRIHEAVMQGMLLRAMNAGTKGRG